MLHDLIHTTQADTNAMAYKPKYVQTVLLFTAYVYGKLYLTNSMEQNLSSEANSYSTSQEIPHILWNLNVYYCVHNSLLVVPILSQKHMKSYS
jgi:hypothetical protein